MATALWRKLCDQAKAALIAGSPGEARRLARRAAELSPNQEEPWLLLAAVAAPKASLEYLKRAYEINPRSQRVKKGLKWAEKRLGSEPNATPIIPLFGNVVLSGLAMLIAAIAFFSMVRPPEIEEGLRVAGAAMSHELNALLATDTPTPTLTQTPTLTPSQTPMPTSTPTITPTETSSPTLTPTTQTNPGAIEKFKVELPSHLETNERWIDINLSEQSLSAYEGENLIDTFIVSTGRGGSPTVTGEFHIWVKVPMQDMSGPGYYIRDVPWVMYFYKSYGIHGTWWHNNFGTPMSAGCVNMTIPDAEWMYGWANVDTIVKVHY